MSAMQEDSSTRSKGITFHYRRDNRCSRFPFCFSPVYCGARNTEFKEGLQRAQTYVYQQGTGTWDELGDED